MYIENIFVLMAAPIIMATFCVGKKVRPMLLFCLVGMGMCLLSAYLNSFFAAIYQADALNATTQIAPVVEELMKLLPLLFYLVVFDPESERFNIAAVVLAAGFATFENVCYLTQSGAANFNFLMIRGFGTGAMHVVCGGAYGRWLQFTWNNKKLRGLCLFGIFCLVITYHAVYNLLVSVGGAYQIVAYLIPVVTVALGWLEYLITKPQIRES